MAITLRDMPAELEKAVKDRSERDNLSLNKTVIRMLEEAAGLSKAKKPVRNSNYDKYLGGWTKEEADAFDARLAELRQIDWEDWK